MAGRLGKRPGLSTVPRPPGVHFRPHRRHSPLLVSCSQCPLISFISPRLGLANLRSCCCRRRCCSQSPGRLWMPVVSGVCCSLQLTAKTFSRPFCLFDSPQFPTPSSGPEMLGRHWHLLSAAFESRMMVSCKEMNESERGFGFMPSTKFMCQFEGSGIFRVDHGIILLINLRLEVHEARMLQTRRGHRSSRAREERNKHPRKLEEDISIKASSRLLGHG